MAEPTVKELNLEIQHLRHLVVSLSATLLCNVALDPSKDCGAATDSEHLVRQAEACFRCARVPNLKKEIAEGLEVAGHEFLAKAMEIETLVQREKRKSK